MALARGYLILLLAGHANANVPVTKNDTCPIPYPSLDTLKDATIDSGAFKTAWPFNMAGTWFVVAVADRFQMPDAFRCTRYNYSVALDGDAHHLDATYLSYNISAKSWIEFHSVGNAYDLTTPGAYREWTTLVVPPGGDPYDAQWYDPIVHFGTDETDATNTIWVRWGCTKAPLGNVQYMEINSRKAQVSWEAVTAAVAHLKAIGAPNIDNLVPVAHDDCAYPWQPAADVETVIYF